MRKAALCFGMLFAINKNGDKNRCLAISKLGASKISYLLWVSLCVVLFSTFAAAQTKISGAVGMDTRWTSADAPYILEGNVELKNGALLTVDPGVTIYMAQDSELTVQAGSLQVNGTQENPVHVLSEKIRQGQAASPGDWKSWTFSADTFNTQLNHVIFKHGRGLFINGSSPILNYVQLHHHQGAAINIDLAASPAGVGNLASDNTLNGVLVPAGSIIGTIRWGLRGIPYVLPSGTLSVGVPPSVSSILPSSLQQGETGIFTITGTRLSGLSEAKFNQAGLVAEVLPGTTPTQATLSVRADADVPSGAVELSLETDAGSITYPNAFTVQAMQPTLASLNFTTLYTGQGEVELHVAGTNFTEQTMLMLDDVAIETHVVSSSQLTAKLNTPNIAGSLALHLQTPDPMQAGEYFTSNKIILPVVATRLLMSPASLSIYNGSAKSLVVSLPYPAPPEGVALTLVSSIPSVASVPSTVTISAGERSVSFDVQAVGLGNSVITASKISASSAQTSIASVAPPTLSLTPGSVTLGSGRTVELSLRSSLPAGADGLVIALSSSDTSIASVPTSVVIPAGHSTTTFALTSSAVGSANITAKASDYENGQATIIVRPTSISLPLSALVVPGLNRSIPVNLSDPAPADGLKITFSSSQPTIATATPLITVPAGQTQASFILNGIATGSSVITASAEAYQSASLPVSVETVTIGLGTSAISIPVGTSTPTFAITLSRPAPAGGITIDLSISDPTKASVSPSSVTIAEGQTSGGVVLASITGIAVGNTSLQASAAGLKPASVAIAVTGKPTLSILSSPANFTVGKGMNAYYPGAYVRRLTSGNAYSPNQALTVYLTSSDPSKVRVPSSVTIPAGNYYAYFNVVGVDITGDVPVQIEASAEGYDLPATKLVASVVNPTLTITSLDNNRGISSTRDNFYISASVPGASGQTAAIDIPLDLSIIEAAPEGIIPGFYSATQGGTQVTQAILKAGQSNTSNTYVYVGTPGSSGTYKVKVGIAGGNSAISAVQNVTAPVLRFSAASLITGKGMSTPSSGAYYIYRSAGGQVLNGTQPLTVYLTSSDPSKVRVPSSVTIPAGSYYAYFNVVGVDITGDVSVQIDASAEGYDSPTTKLVASVVNPTLTINSLDNNRGINSPRDNFYISASVPGASGQTAAIDIPLDLSIIEAAPEGIIPGFYSATQGGTQVTQAILKAGQSNTSNTYVYVDTPSSSGTYKVKVGIAGGNSAISAVQNVTAPVLRFSAASLITGKGMSTPSSGAYYIYRSVGGQLLNATEPLTVYLTSSDPSKVRVPSSVTIPAGSYYAYFNVVGVDITDDVPVQIDASAEGYDSPTTKLVASVVNPTLTISGLDNNRGINSPRDNFYISASVPGASGQTAAIDIPLDLSIIEAAPEGIIPGFYSAEKGGTQVTQAILKAGQSNTSNAYVYVDTPSSLGTYKVKAEIAGGNSAISAAQNAVSPALGFSQSTITVGKGMNSYYQEVYIYRTVGGQLLYGSDSLSVNLSCSSTVICTVPASVTIPAGSYYTYFIVAGKDVGNTTVVGSASGYRSPSDMAVSVVLPQLNFSSLSSSLAIDGKSSFSVYTSIPGGNSSQTASAPITLNLTSSAPGVAAVPNSAIIPTGGKNSETVILTGINAGTTSVTASGANLVSVTSTTVTVK